MAMIKCPECAGDVSSEAKICPKCGKRLRMSLHGKLVLVALALAAIGYVIDGLNSNGCSRSTGQAGSSVPSAAPAPAADPSGGLTMAAFQRIETGMTYEEVCAIVGEPGEEISRTELAGHTTVMYAWKKLGGLANMNAMFQDRKLVSKAQFGLQ